MSETIAGTEAAAAGDKLVLGACCTIQEATALKAQLLRQLDSPPPFLIDGAAVERVDTAGLQAMLAFTLDCLERNIGFAWVARSEALNSAIEVLCLAPLLESPGVSFGP